MRQWCALGLLMSAGLAMSAWSPGFHPAAGGGDSRRMSLGDANQGAKDHSEHASNVASNLASNVASNGSTLFHGDSRDWPALFGPRGDSVSAARGLDWNWGRRPPPLAWEASIGTGYSAPVGANSRVILLHRSEDDELVEARELETGRLQWSCSWKTTFRCRYEYSNGPYSSPVVAHDRVYVIGAEAKLSCVDFAQGERIWQRDLRADYSLVDGLFGFGAGLLVHDGRVYVNIGAGRRQAGVVALDARDGRTIWEATEYGAAYTTPRIIQVGGRVWLLVLTDEALVCLDPATGEIRDEFVHRSRVADTVNAVSPLVHGDGVLVVSGPGAGAASLQVTEEGRFQVRWRDRRVLDSVFNSLVLMEGSVYGFSSMRQGGASLRCVELATGRLAWRLDSELDRGQAIGVDGRLILLGERGHLAWAKANSGAAPAMFMTDVPPLAAPCYTAPALIDGRLLVRNETSLRAYDLRPQRRASMGR